MYSMRPMKHTRHRLNVTRLISQKLCTPRVMRAGRTRFSPKMPAQRSAALGLYCKHCIQCTLSVGTFGVLPRVPPRRSPARKHGMALPGLDARGLAASAHGPQCLHGAAQHSRTQALPHSPVQACIRVWWPYWPAAPAAGERGAPATSENMATPKVAEVMMISRRMSRLRLLSSSMLMYSSVSFMYSPVHGSMS